MNKQVENALKALENAPFGHIVQYNVIFKGDKDSKRGDDADDVLVAMVELVNSDDKFFVGSFEDGEWRDQRYCTGCNNAVLEYLDAVVVSCGLQRVIGITKTNK